MLGNLRDDLHQLVSPDRVQPSSPATMITRGQWNHSLASRRQHDAHEALVTLLQACDAVDLNRLDSILPALQYAEATHTTPFGQIFGGVEKVVVKCNHCNVSSTSFQEFGILSLPLAGRNRVLSQLLSSEVNSNELLREPLS